MSALVNADATEAVVNDVCADDRVDRAVFVKVNLTKSASMRLRVIDDFRADRVVNTGDL